MIKLVRLAAVVYLLLGLEQAYAVPSFARQTGLSCNVCHSNPPELTAFGRNFKLKGYVLTDMTAKDKVGNSKSLLLSKYIPLSAMLLLSNTALQADQPSFAEQCCRFSATTQHFSRRRLRFTLRRVGTDHVHAIRMTISAWTTPTCAMPTKGNWAEGLGIRHHFEQQSNRGGSVE